MKGINFSKTYIQYLALVLFSFAFHEVASAKRLALAIGNDAYQNVPKLQKAGNDASAMARELKSAGFDVQLYRNLNYRDMVRAIESLTKRISVGDEVIVFFAGHGVQIKAGSFMLPIDIEATNENEVEKTAYSLSDLSERLSEAKAAFTLVIVDACRDNPLKSTGRSVGNSRGLSAIEPPKGQMVVYSASRGQQALDRLTDRDPNPNGVFTREFIAKMSKPGLKVEDLVREVQESVEALAQTANHEQRPAIYNEARGNFYFYAPVAPVQVKTKAQLVAKPVLVEQSAEYERPKSEGPRRDLDQLVERMRVDFEKVASMSGNAEALIREWDRFLDNYIIESQNNQEYDRLRGLAEHKRNLAVFLSMQK